MQNAKISGLLHKTNTNMGEIKKYIKKTKFFCYQNDVNDVKFKMPF